MGLQEIIDSIPLAMFLVLAVLSMILMIEVGFRGGMYKRGKPDKAQMAQVRAIMGASLGLLAFMLAFSFAVAQQHFESRTNAYLLEVTAIDAAYNVQPHLPHHLDHAVHDVFSVYDRHGLSSGTYRQA